MADKVLTVRVPEEIAEKIEGIAEKLNEEFGKKFSTSDILRSAIDRDLKREEEMKDNLFLKLPFHKDMSVVEIKHILGSLKGMQHTFSLDSVNEAIKKYEEHLEYAEFLEWKANNKK
ncbi:hypothetical protein [Neobacillus sp.]|uniref:hypothetical protein n=1 Tax=Neobacillus sp. TaxID=2675273 RepID=UPI00289BFCF4|nr:hypothetical protein [Neobacillus sp.]